MPERAEGEFSLLDAVRVAHPRPVDDRQDLICKLLTGNGRHIDNSKLARLLPQIAAWRALIATRDPYERLRLIEEGRLPYEAVVGAVRPRAKIWRALVYQMPLFALLRHLATLVRRRALNCPETLEYVCKRLSDPHQVRASRIFPYRFYAAWKRLEIERNSYSEYCERTYAGFSFCAGRQYEIYDALMGSLEKALSESLANTPKLDGRVCIALDVSGSMTCNVSRKSAIRLVDLASLFAAGIAARSSQRAIILPFDNSIRPVTCAEGCNIMEYIQYMSSLGGGGTALSAPVSYLLKNRLTIDHFIGITDNEEWATDDWHGRGFLPVWREYRRKLNPDARASLLTLAPYRDAVAPDTEPGIYYFYGWSDELVRYLTLCASGKSQLEEVRKLSIQGGDHDESGTQTGIHKE